MRAALPFIHRLPFARRLYQKYLPLMPMALEQLDLSGYDLVISTESGPAKGVVLPPETAPGLALPTSNLPVPATNNTTS